VCVLCLLAHQAAPLAQTQAQVQRDLERLIAAHEPIRVIASDIDGTLLNRCVHASLSAPHVSCCAANTDAPRAQLRL
jgi:hypothetical protein